MGTTILSTWRGVLVPATKARAGQVVVEVVAEGVVAGDLAVSVRRPSILPRTVAVTVKPGLSASNGPRGDLERRQGTAVDVVPAGRQLVVTRPADRRAEHHALHGLTRSLVADMVEA